MSLLSELRPAKGSQKTSKRLGRGMSSGKGGTSTKGHKGQKARSGGTIQRGFEGGQMPMARRLPKFGFSNRAFEKRYEIFNLSQLERFDGEVTPEALKEAGMATTGQKIKILGDGELKKSLTVKAHKFSKKAQSAIESAGGKVEVII